MGKRDPRVDAYIARSAEFARPILEQVRETVHATCPDVEETMKWSFPHFQYKGLLCSMAAFKEHCAFGFWKAPLIEGLSTSNEAMGQLGRIAKPSDLPATETLTGWIRQAMRLNEEGTKTARKAAARPKPSPAVPEDLASALRKNAKAREAFEAFPDSCRREYVEWIEEARQEATRARRLATTIEWLAEGKRRNWKYEAGVEKGGRR